MNPAEWLSRTAARAPNAPALLRDHEILADYATFAARVAAIAGNLSRTYNIGPGDRVAIFMANCTQYLEAMYAVWFTGAAVIPINAKLHAKEAAWIIENADARLALVAGDAGHALEQAAPTCLKTLIAADSPDWVAMYQAKPLTAPALIDSDDLLWLFYTSGTTGRPKGVMVTAGNISAMTMAYFADVDTVTADDAILYAAPMSHGAGIYNFMHVIKGARHVVPASGGFDAGEILTLAAKLRNVSIFAAPTMVKRLVDHARKTTSTGEGIKTIVYAGGPMYTADIIDASQVMGNRFVQIYGQGECPMGITALSRDLVSDRSHPNWRARLGSVGVAQSTSLVRIAAADSSFLPPGEIGEIVVRGPVVMQGYWQNPDATAATIKDGWLWTGDMGAMDEDGFITLHDRSKDMIISGGSNIYPREVEEVLLSHAGVSEAAVVGRTHPEWGEEVIAFIVPTNYPDISLVELDAFCLANIARFKRPKEYHIVPELPKNNYGKVLKSNLRAMLKRDP